jgi:sulfotransferase
VSFDRSLGWLGHLEMAEAALGRPVRVLVPVRDLRDVLARCEFEWRQLAATRQPAQENQFYFETQTVDGRCAVWVRGDQPVGLAFNRIKGARQRGLRDRMHFVRYEELTNKPHETLRAIYEFLGENPFEHDIAHLPLNRPRLEASQPLWPQLLGAAATPYANQNLW